MSVALFSHPAGLAHDPGPGHPEQPARLRVVMRALDGGRFVRLDRRSAPRATVTQVARAHRLGYVEGVMAAAPAVGCRVTLDADTHLSHGSVEAALRAAGGAIAAVDAVMDGSAHHGFVATRPPGHHAEADRAMGFCVFNNVAVAALHGRAQWGVRRVAVLDFDVHHGNGTQAMFWGDPALFYGSTHQSPCYPGTGRRDERGVAGNIVNRPLPPGSGSVAFRTAWQEILVALAGFRPELVIASAGFDAHRDDPLAQMELDEADFAWIARQLSVAAGGRLVSVLEGGYDLTALAASVSAYVGALLDEGTHG